MYYVMGGQYGTRFLLCLGANSEPIVSTFRNDPEWELLKDHSALYLLSPQRTLLSLVRDVSDVPFPKTVVLTPEQKSAIESVIQLKEAANAHVPV